MHLHNIHDIFLEILNSATTSISSSTRNIFVGIRNPGGEELCFSKNGFSRNKSGKNGISPKTNGSSHDKHNSSSVSSSFLQTMFPRKYISRRNMKTYSSFSTCDYDYSRPCPKHWCLEINKKFKSKICVAPKNWYGPCPILNARLPQYNRMQKDDMAKVHSSHVYSKLTHILELSE